MTPKELITTHQVSGIKPGHMGRATYFADTGNGTLQLLCDVDLIPEALRPKVGDTMTRVFKYHLHGNVWEVRVNGATVFERTMEQVERERAAQEAFIQERKAHFRAQRDQASKNA